MKAHLTTAVEGTSIKLDDKNLTDYTNLMYLKKVYKLGNDPRLNQKSGEYNKATDHITPNNLQEKQRLVQYMESVILGIIALKG